ncbi:unnamed protein product [Parajaminaea phylloscopi]
MSVLPPPTLTTGDVDGPSDAHIQIVHTTGITRVLFAPTEAHIDRLFTAGDDFLVRLLPTSHTSSIEPLLIEDATAPVTWIDAGKTHLVVASEDGSVRLYNHRQRAQDEDSQLVGPTRLVEILTRTSLPTRCVALEKAVPPGKSPRAAICSDELIVKVVDVNDIRRVNLLTGHARSVRAASWCPTKPVLVTSSCDGTARIWDCSTPEPDCTKVLDGLPLTKPEDETDVHAEWHPSGHSFVLPSKGNELIIYSSSQDQGWARSGVFAAASRGTSAVPPPTGPVTALAFSPNGRYLAAATQDGQVTIWEMSSRTPVRARRAEAHVTGLSWHPSANAMAWTDTDGQLIRWQDVLSSSYASPCERITFEHAHTDHGRSRVDDLFAGLDDEDEEGDNDNDDGLVDDEAHDSRGKSARVAFANDDDGLADFVVDDDASGGYAKALEAERRRRPKSYQPRSSGPLALRAKQQDVFQPNSTPMRNSRRFLSLTLFGSLLSIDQDTHHVVSFESFNTAARRNWKLVDHFGYTMASVGASGAVLACPKKGDSKSAVHFKPFEAAGAWSTPGAEWGAEMPAGEEVVAVAMGGAPPRPGGSRSGDDVADAAAALTSTAVVATSAGYLRFFSSSGLQRYVWAFGSPVVALAAGKQHAIVVHRSQTASDGFQYLNYTLIDLISFQIKQTGSLPLAKDVTLQWVGFNELDVPTLYDSRGVLCLLDRAFAAPGQARWTPMLDTTALSAPRETEGDEGDHESLSRTRFWPVATSATQLFCVFLRGQASFPDPSASGHPLIQELDLKLPLVGLDIPGAELEEKHLRQTLLASTVRSAFASLVVPPTEYASEVPDPTALVHESDKDLLQIIQLACKSDKHARALDAARELHGNRMLDAALQIAGFFHLTSLADRMDSLREWVETRAERDERLEREGVEGVATEEFAEAASRSRRVFAASSPSPAAVPSTSSQARRALVEDFHTSTSATPRRSQQLRGLGEDALDTTAPSSSLASTSAMPPPPRPASAARERLGAMSDEDDDGLHGSVRKRKSPEVTDGSSNERVFQKQRSSSSSASAFNKTTIGTSRELGSAASVARPNRNPFARQPGMTRDRSMHKSNSFFDRAEADLSAPSAAAGSSGGGGGGKGGAGKKTKQATLFGLGGASARSTSMSSSNEVPARPALGESQSENSQLDDGVADDNDDEESLRLTLSNAVDKAARREQRGGLEETQAVDEDMETQSTDGGGGGGSGSGGDGRSKLEAFRRHTPVTAT